MLLCLSLLGRAQLQLIPSPSSCTRPLGRGHKGRSYLTLVREFPGECEGFTGVRHELAVAQCFSCVLSGFSHPPCGSQQWLLCPAVTTFGMTPAVWRRHQCNDPGGPAPKSPGTAISSVPSPECCSIWAGQCQRIKGCPTAAMWDWLCLSPHPESVSSRDLLPLA